jgi:hypothetical protein
MMVFGKAHLRRIVVTYGADNNEARIHRPLNKDARSIARFSASAPSHHNPFSAVFTTNIAESNFWYMQGNPG